MKRLISILIVLASIVLLCCGCNKEADQVAQENSNDNKLLPYGLKFGMTHSEAVKTYASFPAISKDASTGLYECDFTGDASLFNIDSDKLYEDMMNGNGLVMDPSYYFTFNKDEKLCKFAVETIIQDSEQTAEYLFNAYVDYFTKELSAKADTKEGSTLMSAKLETETVLVQVIATMSRGEFVVSATISSKTYK